MNKSNKSVTNIETSALQQAYNNTSVTGIDRHINNRKIINQYQNSNDPLDLLAVAFSFEREGVSCRKQAISYFERFLEKPSPIPIIPNTYTSEGDPKPLFSYWEIYSTLASLYEKEHDFDNALKYLRLLPKESNYNNPADYIRVGDVLAKVDINQAVVYYEELKKDRVYQEHKRAIDIAYSQALKKQEEGYVYKQKKTTVPKGNSMYCPNCGRQQSETADYCINCGTKVRQFEKTCPRCSTKYTSNACPNCGYIINGPAQRRQVPIQKPTTIQTVSPAPPIIPIVQNQPRIVCPRCHGTNVNIQAINNIQLEDKRHGCAWWIFVGWWWVPIKWLFFTLPALIIKIFKPKKQKVVNTVHSFAVCQSCGYQWRV